MINVWFQNSLGVPQYLLSLPTTLPAGFGLLFLAAGLALLFSVSRVVFWYQMLQQSALKNLHQSRQEAKAYQSSEWGEKYEMSPPPDLRQAVTVQAYILHILTTIFLLVYGLAILFGLHFSVRLW